MTREEIMQLNTDYLNGVESEHSMNELFSYALEKEPCEDTISRKSLKQKLQEHHDFFVNAYGGFSNLPQNDKSRVDEITNCIAMVVNEPPVTPQQKTGKWIFVDKAKEHARCSECDYGDVDLFDGRPHNYCPNCGAKMQEEVKEKWR